MRADGRSLAGWNRYWIRFFLCAVFATMYVRDHARPAFHAALGVDIDWYDMRVLRLTSEISRQVFPIELDLENPAFKARLDRLSRISAAMDAARRRGGAVGWLRRGGLGARAGLTFAGLYLMPVKRNVRPESSRLQPVW